jgi:hypothetical protein
LYCFCSDRFVKLAPEKNKKIYWIFGRKIGL